MSTTRPPRRHDVLHLGGEHFTYIDRLIGRGDEDRFEIIDQHGEAFIVRRATEGDADLRQAVHDDGQRQAWKLAA